MRILFIHNYYQYSGGEDIIVDQEIKLLKAAGHIVELLSFTNESFNGTFIGDVGSALNSIYNNRSSAQLKSLIQNFFPDIIHIHNLFYTASPSIISTAKKYNIPVVLTLHNYRLICSGGLLMRSNNTTCELCTKSLLPLSGITYACFRDSRLQSAQLTLITSLHKVTGIWKSVDRYIVLTEFAKRKFINSSLGLSESQVIVKPNFVPDLGYKEAKNRSDSYLYIGRLSEEKGINILLSAAYHYSFPLEFIGDGPMKDIVERAANELPHVSYLGKLQRADVIARLKNCKAIIIPSLWYEGLPTVLLEAYATGTPVICSDQANLNELVDNGKTGLLFKTGNVPALINAIKQHQVENNDYGVCGRKIYESMYNPEVALNQLIDIYQNLIK